MNIMPQRKIRPAQNSQREGSDRLPLENESSFLDMNRNVRLLTPEEETDLVRQLSKLRDKIYKWIKPVLDQAPEGTRLGHFDQQIAYFLNNVDSSEGKLLRKVKRMLDQYNDVKHCLVMSNLPWVTKLARSQRQPNIGEEDLFQEGVCGLLKAIDRFEAERGLRLMTYATWYIREAMQQIRARQSHLVSISSHDQTLLGQLESKVSDFQHRNLRIPRSTELGEKVRGNHEVISRLQMATRPPISLERSGNDGSIPVPTEDPIPEYDRQEEMGAAVLKLLAALPSRERFIVSRRFGLEGHEPTSLETLGMNLRVSKERVRQLQRQALKRMQKIASEQEVEFKFVE